MPPSPKKEIKVSHDAFEELTSALAEAGIKLEKDDSFTVTKDMAIKGPIFYRQVNLRHEILKEVVKVYKSPMDKNESFETNDVNQFIGFLDDVYKYCLTGEKPTETTPTGHRKPATSKW